MVGYLESNDYPISDNCVVEIETVSTVGSTKAPATAPVETPEEPSVENINVSSTKNNFVVTIALILAVAAGIRL